MFLEALGSAVLGLALAWFATHRLPHRLPGSLLVILVGALVVSAASLSLLLRPAERFRRRSATA